MTFSDSAESANARFLQQELDWLQRLIHQRFQLHFAAEEANPGGLDSIEPPVVESGRSKYEDLLLLHKFDFWERAALALAIAPHLQPNALDLFFTRNAALDRCFTEFGGVAGSRHSGFLPTGETLLFLLAGDNLEARFKAQRLLEPDHPLMSEAIFQSMRSEPGLLADEPLLSARLRINEDFLQRYCRGRLLSPMFSSDFPARRVSTALDWSDLVLNPDTRDHLVDIQDWLQYGELLASDPMLSSRMRKGYTCLFYGPPGTGKTLTACLLGEHAEREVYRIDLSMVVSKWVGETEKNLARIFDQAEGQRWILFFDEADALFGKRTDASSGLDRYANQEVSYLLQRIEDFAGLTILASNKKDNIDQAFTRRFQSIVNFPIPSAEQRKVLWQQAFSERVALEPAINLASIAAKYEIPGGVIVNIAQYCSIKSLKRGDGVIRLHDVTAGLEKELLKEGFFPG